MIKHVAFIIYPVKDMTRGRKFYGETLKLTEGETFGEQWVEYEIGGVAFGITDAFGSPGTAGSVAFEVDDLEAELARLKGVGVAIDGDINDFPGCRMFLFKDPDGNTLCFHQLKKK